MSYYLKYREQKTQEAEDEWQEYIATEVDTATMMGALISVFMFRTEDLARVMRSTILCEKPFEACLSAISEQDAVTRGMLNSTLLESSSSLTSAYKETFKYHRTLQSEIKDMNLFSASELLIWIENMSEKYYRVYDKAISTTISLSGTGLPKTMQIREFASKLNSNPLDFLKSPSLNIDPKSFPSLISALRAIFDSTISLENLYLINTFTIARAFRSKIVSDSFEVWICSDEENASRYRKFLSKYQGASTEYESSMTAVSQVFGGKGVVLRDIKGAFKAP
jgi:hypothetical protein